jgi:Ni,Fe-hydrogenase III small subunit
MNAKTTRKSAISIPKMLLKNLLQVILRKSPTFKNVRLPSLSKELTKPSHSIFIRHLDCGSCNACELELNALLNPVYDIGQYGIHFEASPRHADVLIMTGPYTRNLDEAARLTLEAMPVPRVITFGDCTDEEGVFAKSYAVVEHPPEMRSAIESTGIHIPGCPPPPEKILEVLLKLPPKLT